MYDIDQNDPVAMTTLWESVAPRIKAAAINYKNTTGLNEDIEDLVQDGYFALLQAIETYNPVQYPDVSFALWTVIKCKRLWSKYTNNQRSRIKDQQFVAD